MKMWKTFFIRNSIEITKTIIEIIHSEHWFFLVNWMVVIRLLEFQDSDESNLLIELESINVLVVKLNNAA